MHGPFTPDTRAFYSRHGSKVWISGLTRAQLDTAPPGLQCVGAIPNPINVHAWRLMAEKERYLLWVGRMTPEKGPHRAIAVADQADRPLVIAGPIQPGQREFFDAEVAPHLDGEHVRYMEEVGGREKRELFAHAAALLMPIRWPEPFGMVMIEAMACGTPVLAFDEGAVPEVVVNGESGYIVKDEGEMAAAVRLLGELDPARCRACVTERFSAEVVSGAYEAAYRRVIAAERGESLDRHTRLRSMPDSG
jgi:glycosyltransferase involved in cell wall biosynthesis